MEQRSQILKQMHLTKNEREREVRTPRWGSQNHKLLQTVGLHRCGRFWAAIPGHQESCIHLSPPNAWLPCCGGWLHVAVASFPAPSQRLWQGDRLLPL